MVRIILLSLIKANFGRQNISTGINVFFRRRGNFTVAQQISDMFRVFVPVFNNQENTVITPLLATGHQVGMNALHVLIFYLFISI